MKTENRYRENPVQDLLNAVVIQAAEDYRDCCARLMKKPNDKRAKDEREEIRRFFLSEDFIAYSQADGAMILARLDAEQQNLERQIVTVKTMSNQLLAVWKCFWESENNPALFDEIVCRLDQLQEIRKTVPKSAVKYIRASSKEKEIRRYVIRRKAYE